jgi:hypothetical protein
MAQRSRADKVEDGRKGTVRKIAQYGPDELNRAGRQAARTKTRIAELRRQLALPHKSVVAIYAPVVSR